MKEEIRVVTLWQPWASLLALGLKLNETRPNDTSFRGTYLIHAAQKWTKFQKELCLKEPFFTELKNQRLVVDFINEDTKKVLWVPMLPLGSIIGKFEVDRCLKVQQDRGKYNHAVLSDGSIITGNEFDFGDYSLGRSIWIGKNHRKLIRSLPYKNGQGYYQRFRGNINDLKFV